METDKTDLELIQEFQSGSSPAFDALYERYRRPLYGYVNRQMQGHTSQADDVFQQTWMRAIDNLSTYRDQEKFSAWLMRIAHNLIIDYYRSLKRRAEDELDDTYGDTTADTSDETPGRDGRTRTRQAAHGGAELADARTPRGLPAAPGEHPVPADREDPELLREYESRSYEICNQTTYGQTERLGN